ncbi:MAG: S1 RNA-binding domain-containing protein [Planctomycetia bacterium]|nr:S1 RNA-binding domain-containing protein [Planctomycetia bacterium]
MENNEVTSREDQVQEPTGTVAEDVAAVTAETPVETPVENMAEQVEESVQPEEPAAANLEAAREELLNKHAPTSAEEEAAIQAAIGGSDLDAMLTSSVVAPVALEVNAKVTAKVSRVSGDNVFVELPGHAEGVVSAKQFSQVPEAGAELSLVVVAEPKDDGLYELNVPGAAVSAPDYSSVEKGMIVDTTVTGHNSGGLECKVNGLRGFIPISQIAPQRIENLEEFVGQKLQCVITEVNPKRRNLVLSRRKVLDKERESVREELIKQLQPGQIYKGTVRKIMDFGAFVDIGGIDGLLHISQLSWERIKHPSDVLKEGQEIQVQVEKVDPVTHKISFAYKDMIGNPWNGVEERYAVDSEVHGKVTKLMQFGAFVELERGIEGLVHISEIAHQHVARVQEYLNVGDEVAAKVLSVDRKARRISLSIKALTEAPKRDDKEDGKPDRPREEALPAGGRPKNYGNRPLRGGVGGDSANRLF